MLLPLGIGAAVLVLLALFAVTAYNGLVVKRNRVKNAWAQIDVQLKRRIDLIPNLVNAVRGYLQHERGLLEGLARARSAAVAAGSDVTQRAPAENQISQAMRSLFAVVESYPQLQANDNVRALQEELSSTENRIAYARQAYNDAVLDYNNARETFPRSVFAGMFSFDEAALFAVNDPAERAVPAVQL